MQPQQQAERMVREMQTIALVRTMLLSATKECWKSCVTDPTAPQLSPSEDRCVTSCGKLWWRLQAQRFAANARELEQDDDEGTGGYSDLSSNFRGFEDVEEKL